ncbi:hypothetical protein HDU76_006061, partial [Blyttiomyces sp. JEL0837]
PASAATVKRNVIRIPKANFMKTSPNGAAAGAAAGATPSGNAVSGSAVKTTNGNETDASKISSSSSIRKKPPAMSSAVGGSSSGNSSGSGSDSMESVLFQRKDTTRSNGGKSSNSRPTLYQDFDSPGSTATDDSMDFEYTSQSYQKLREQFNEKQEIQQRYFNQLQPLILLSKKRASGDLSEADVSSLFQQLIDAGFFDHGIASRNPSEHPELSIKKATAELVRRYQEVRQHLVFLKKKAEEVFGAGGVMAR